MRIKIIARPSVSWILLLLIVAQVVHGQGGDEIKYIRLHVGSVKAINVGEVDRIAAGRDDILGSTVLNNGELLLIPKGPGETDLHIWKPGERKVVYRVNILGENMFNKKTLVSSLLSSFKGVEIRTKDSYLIIEGNISPEDAERYEAVVAGFPGVFSMVKVKKFTPQDMVKIRLQVLEIDKRGKDELGIKWNESMNGPVVGVATSLVQNGVYKIPPGNDVMNWAGALAGTGVTDPYAYPYAGFAGGLSSKIKLIEQKGIGRTLAEPTLVTRSGESAAFKSGGQFPVVFSEQGDSRVSFKDYGVLFTVKPVVDEHENILVTVNAEVSSIDFGSAVQGVPGIKSRNTDSVVNVKNGETIVISGLLNVFSSKEVSKLPFFGSLPLVGRFFRTKNVEENRNELLVLVTPEIVKSGEKSVLPNKLMEKHIKELQKVKEGYIEDELLE